SIDNTKVRESQIARLHTVKNRRDGAACAAALAELAAAARRKDGNLLTLAVEAARARATVGEISDALEAVFTRHRATVQSVSGVYGGAFAEDAGFQRIQAEVEAFARAEGRRPRMLVTKMGQ